MERLQWSVPHRSGWIIEIGPLPERKMPYLVLSTSDGMVALARFLDDKAAETFALILDEFTGTQQEGE